MDSKKLGVLLRQKRQSMGMTVAALARRAGVSTGTIWILERGENYQTGKPTQPSQEILERLAAALTLDQAELAGLWTLAGHEEKNQGAQPSGSILQKRASRQSAEEFRLTAQELYGLVQRLEEPGIVKAIKEALTKLNTLAPLLTPSPAFRTYYPALDCDPLWRIASENNDLKWLWGASFLGKHLLEIVYSEAFQKSQQGQSWHSVAERMVQCFSLITAPYDDPGDKLHDEYRRIMKSLQQLPRFSKLRRESSLANTSGDCPDHSGIPVYLCHVLAPCRFSSRNLMLSFQWWMMQVAQEDEAIPTKNYRLIFVPENPLSHAALILLHLASDQEARQRVTPLPVEQQAVKVALLQTIEQGIAKDNANVQWKPEQQFMRFLNPLEYDHAEAIRVGQTSPEPFIQKWGMEIEQLEKLLKVREGIQSAALEDLLKDFISYVLTFPASNNKQY